MMKHIVEMNAESIGQKIQVRDVGIERIIFQQNQYAPLLDPRGDLSSVLIGYVVRFWILYGNVRRRDDIELRVGQLLLCWGRRKRRRVRPVAAEDVAQQRIAAVAPVRPLVMKIVDLARGILASLAVVPSVKRDRLSAPERRSRFVILFRCGKKKRAQFLDFTVVRGWRG